jgi:AraC-like DNA-binding protein
MPIQTDTSKKLREIHFENPRLNSVGVELMTLADLCGRASAELLRRPERINFHIVSFVTRGTGTHTIDFVDHPIQAGSLVCVQPSQVHQWHMNPTLEGFVLIFEPSALNTSGIVDQWPACCQTQQPLQSVLTQALQQLSQDLHGYSPRQLDVALIRQGLAYLLLRIARWRADQDTTDAPAQADKVIYGLFVKELEKNFRQRLGVQSYAHKLGYSQSTLARACLCAEGRSAKVIIDRRVALEAKRLLVHGADSISQIGYHLGFSELTNFVKFFNRLVGMTPAAFRAKRDSASTRPFQATPQTHPTPASHR